ncbi:MAG: diaminopimelate decarboxylase [Methanobacterium sp.]|jgi:diaminopimelate decarboxylase|uniref:diaminopimelate decarboxylase n=1 Tax=Methanobacterium sp. TaxID=2164 RepID=UPI002582DED5|nr:diaminopimelate decarboxylase [Methanobacterium sp.]MCC7560959.1 diaminopimelate decarboxylase [Methanobacterium sp.]
MNLHFKTNEKGNLDIGGADALEIAQEYGTPLYVTDEMRVRDNYRRVYQAFTNEYEDFKIFYAAKANTSLAMMKILEQEGSCIDAVSPGEIYTALMAGFEGDRILYTGNNVTTEELKFALDAGVRVNLDSVSMLERLAKIPGAEGTKISFRVNPMVGAGHHDHCITGGELSKFGIMEHEAVQVYQKAIELGFKPVGIHTHIGSGILDPEPFKLAVQVLMDVAGRVNKEAGVTFEFIDFGGGLGIPYTPEEGLLDIEKFAKEIVGLYQDKLAEHNMGQPTMCIEPGRYIVGDASYLLTQVNTVKQSYRKFIGVNAGFNTLLRPTMYGSYHHILVADKPEAEPTENIDVAGNICESGDLFARARPLPEIKEGDILAIMNAGAYAFSMASQYNSRPLPAEVMVCDGAVDIIRERENFADLYRKQNIPLRLLK